MKYLICLVGLFSLSGCRHISVFDDYYIQIPATTNAGVYTTSASISIDNCLIVGGRMWGQVAFGNNVAINSSWSNQYQEDLFITKFNQNNEPIFAKLIASASFPYRTTSPYFITISDIALDDACNIYICGTFQGDLLLHPIGATNKLINTGSTDGFYAKLDPAGNMIWIKQIGGAGNQLIKSIKVEGKDIYIAGTFSPAINLLTQQVVASGGLGNGFYCRYQQTDGLPGANGWEKIITATDRFSIDDLDVNRDSILLAGSFFGTCNFSGITKVAQFNDAYFAKAAKDGIIHSVGQFGIQNNNSALLVQSGFLDANGGVVCSGIYAGQVDFDPGLVSSVQTSIAGSYDTFIAGYDNHGQNLWVNVYGSSEPENYCLVKKDLNQEIFAVGEYNRTVNFGAGTLSVVAPSGGAFILKLKPTGIPLWVADAQYSHTGLSGIAGFAVSPNRYRMVAGLNIGGGQITKGFSGINYPANTNKWTYLTFYGN